MDYAAELLDQNRALAGSLAGADLAIPVPTCPGWTLLQLLRHVGRGHRWAAEIIHRRTVEVDPREVPGGRPPDDEDGALEWLRSGADLVVQAVSDAGPQTPVPTLTGTRPAQWWLRRRLHEATVHRADVAITRSMAFDLSPELAVDGIDEWLELLATRSGQDEPPPLGEGQSLVFQATDPGSAGRTWRLEGVRAGIVRTEDALPADTTVAGPAADLFLAMVRRIPLERTGARISGDPGRWDGWLAGTPL